MIVRRLAVGAAWLGLLAIIFVTLSPIGLRPHIGGPNYERFFAFAAIGALFGIAYPRYMTRVGIILIVFAIGLEALQLISPDRHGTLLDAIVKCVGSAIGLVFALGVNRLTKNSETSAR